jgi:hypothetical protein
MTYIDKLIHEIAEEYAYNDSKQTKFLLGFLLGSLMSLLFWIILILEFYTLAPFKWSAKGVKEN